MKLYSNYVFFVPYLEDEDNLESCVTGRDGGEVADSEPEADSD